MLSWCHIMRFERKIVKLCSSFFNINIILERIENIVFFVYWRVWESNNVYF